MKTLFIPLLAISIGVVGNLSVADAQGTQSRTVEIFKALDANGDGTLTAAEVGKQREKYFSRLVRIGDSNKDGELTRAEFLAAAGREAPEVRRSSSRSRRSRSGRSRQSDSRLQFARLDRNRDGKLSLKELPQFLQRRYKPLFDRLGKTELTREEFASAGNRSPQNAADSRRRAEAFFQQLDTNKDGKLTVKEAPERMKRIVEALFQRANKPVGGELTKAEFLRSAPNRRPGNSSGQAAVAAMMRQLDKNRNGAIDKDEAQGRIRENFDRIDANKNGKIEREELARIQRDRSTRGNRFPKRKRPQQ